MWPWIWLPQLIPVRITPWIRKRNWTLAWRCRVRGKEPGRKIRTKKSRATVPFNGKLCKTFILSRSLHQIAPQGRISFNFSDIFTEFFEFEHKSAASVLELKIESAPVSLTPVSVWEFEKDIEIALTSKPRFQAEVTHENNKIKKLVIISLYLEHVELPSDDLFIYIKPVNFFLKLFPKIEPKINSTKYLGHICVINFWHFNKLRRILSS
jgi:hypothetical protein